jgi:uncharacterized protein (TIGR02466 family)
MDEGIIHEQGLWNIGIYSIVMPDYEVLKDKCVEHIKTVKLDKPHLNKGNEHYQKIGPMEQRHKRNLIESWGTLFDNRDSEEFNQVIDFCHSVTLNVAKRVNEKYVDTSNWLIRMKESWSHITQNGGYHDYHDHPYCSWCGIFYVDAGDTDSKNKNGNNRFYTPLKTTPEIGLEFLSHTFHDPVAQTGKLIVFPSILPHSAMPYFGERDRVVVAFNAEIADARDVGTNTIS